MRSGAEYYRDWDRIADALDEEDAEDGAERRAAPAPEAPASQEEEAERTADGSRAADDAWASGQAASMGRALGADGTEALRPAAELEWLAEREREQGNESFRAREYLASVDAYSRGIALLGLRGGGAAAAELGAVLRSNRARMSS